MDDHIGVIFVDIKPLKGSSCLTMKNVAYLPAQSGSLFCPKDYLGRTELVLQKHKKFTEITNLSSFQRRNPLVDSLYKF